MRSSGVVVATGRVAKAEPGFDLSEEHRRSQGSMRGSPGDEREDHGDQNSARLCGDGGPWSSSAAPSALPTRFSVRRCGLMRSTLPFCHGQ